MIYGFITHNIICKKKVIVIIISKIVEILRQIIPLEHFYLPLKENSSNMRTTSIDDFI